MRTYTTCAPEATDSYEYGFACDATYCVRIRLVCSKRLMHTSMALRVNQLIPQHISRLVDVGMAVVWMLDNLFDISMTVVMDAR